MNEPLSIEILFKSQTAVIATDELALLESILPEIIHAMMREEELTETD